MSIKRVPWNKALLASLAIHLLTVGSIALFCMHTPTQGGAGMLTVEFGGPAGDAGGFGEQIKSGQQGNSGSGGDGAKQFAQNKKFEKTESQEEKPAEKAQGENAQEPPQRAQMTQTSELKPDKANSESVSEKLLETHDSGEIVAQKEVVKPKKLKPEEKKTEKFKKVESPKTRKVVKHDKPVKGDEIAPKRDKAVKSLIDGKDGKAKKVSTGSGGAVGAQGALVTANQQGQASGQGQGQGSDFGDGRFVANGDGTYTAIGSAGISYKILYEKTPVYPRQARSIGFNRIVKVRVRFLVGLSGQVESAQMTTKNIPDLGFKEAALSAVHEMRFEPIYHQGHNIKMYFNKTIIFQP